MQIKQFNSREEWLDARLGRITGSRLGNLVSKRDKTYKQGFYELIAERIAVPASDEAAMDRGNRLEDEAVEKFAAAIGKKVSNELVMWSRDEDENIAISPDASIGKTIAIEVKCLSSAKHIEAWLTKKIPSEYESQVIQYFVVNDKLKKLYFVFYDPRMPKDLFWLEFTRADMQERVDEYLALERDILIKVSEIEKQLTF